MFLLYFYNSWLYYPKLWAGLSSLRSSVFVGLKKSENRMTRFSLSKLMSALRKWQNPNPANACWNLSVLSFGDYRVYLSGRCEMNVTHIILMCVSANPKVGSPSEWVAQLGALCDNTCVILYISISPRQEGRRHTVTVWETDTQIHVKFYGIQYFCKWEKGGWRESNTADGCLHRPSIHTMDILLTL